VSRDKLLYVSGKMRIKLIVLCIVVAPITLADVFSPFLSLLVYGQHHQEADTEPAIVQPTTSWNWNPADEHPCTIPRYSDEQWHRTRFTQYPAYHRNHVPNHPRRRQPRHSSVPYGVLPSLYHEPVVLRRNRSVNELFRLMTERDNLLHHFYVNFTVTLSSSNALSEHRQTMLLSEYLHDSWMAHETTPYQLSNETWYLFGETYTKEWKELLQHYVLPPCATCEDEQVALSFGIGNRGSGIQWHVHGPGFSEALHGRKHWVLYPPTYDNNSIVTNDITAQEQQQQQHTINHFHKDQSSRQWMENVYPTVPVKPWECTLDPGDVIYFPNQWWHATINLDRYTAFISTFTTEHNSIRMDWNENPNSFIDEL
jgi:Cupin-like domain